MIDRVALLLRSNSLRILLASLGLGAFLVSSPLLAAVPATLISRNAPVYASSGNAARASGEDLGTYWRSSGIPATLTYDLSRIAPAARRQILVVWYNDLTYGYDHRLAEGPGYNNLRSYTLEGNAAPGGGEPPATGWVVLGRVTGNTLHSRSHVLEFGPYNWLRFNVLEGDGSPSNSDAAAHVDIYDVGHGVADGWLFLGDSITANGMGHGRVPATNTLSFGGEVGRLIGITPPQENGGMPSWSSINAARFLPQWLAEFPGRYVTLAFGTNDAGGGLPPREFLAHMSALAQAVVAAGKVPVIPTIPWSREASRNARILGLNAEIRHLYESNPKVVAGPDLYALFSEHQQYISDDGLHPSEEGYGALRRAWAAMAVQHVYAAAADPPGSKPAH